MWSITSTHARRSSMPGSGRRWHWAQDDIERIRACSFCAALKSGTTILAGFLGDGRWAGLGAGGSDFPQQDSQHAK
jgi:hypothetical protein